MTCSHKDAHCCTPHNPLTWELCSHCLDPLPPAAAPGWCPTLDQGYQAPPTCCGHTMFIGSTNWVCHAATKMDRNVHPAVSSLGSCAPLAFTPCLQLPGWCPTLDQGRPICCGHTIVIASTSWVCHTATKMDGKLQRCKGKLVGHSHSTFCKC